MSYQEELIEALEQNSLVGFALWRIVWKVEVASFEHARIRERLIPALLLNARRLQASLDEEGVPSLLALLRRYVSLAEPSNVLVLFDFLRDAQDASVKLTALEGLRTAFLAKAPEELSKDREALLKVFIASGKMESDPVGPMAAAVLGLLVPSGVRALAKKVATFSNAAYVRACSRVWHDAARFRGKRQGKTYKGAVGILHGEEVEDESESV